MYSRVAKSNQGILRGSFMIYVSSSTDSGSKWQLTDTSDGTISWVPDRLMHDVACSLILFGEEVVGVDAKSIHLLCRAEVEGLLDRLGPRSKVGDPGISKLAVLRTNLYERGIDLQDYTTRCVRDIVNLALSGSGISVEYKQYGASVFSSIFLSHCYMADAPESSIHYGFSLGNYSKPDTVSDIGWPMDFRMIRVYKMANSKFYDYNYLRTLHRRLYLDAPAEIVFIPSNGVVADSPVYISTEKYVRKDYLETELGPILLDIFNFVRSCIPELKAHIQDPKGIKGTWGSYVFRE